MNLGTMIDNLFELREKKRKLEEETKAITSEMEKLQSELITEMQAAGTPKSSGMKASVSIKESIVPTAKDWEAIYRFIDENDAIHLMERRVSVSAYREMRKLIGGEIPGIEPFTKLSVSLVTR